MGKKPEIIKLQIKQLLIFGDFLKAKKTKEDRKKKRQNKKAIKDKIIRDIRTLLGQGKEEDYYEPKRVSNFWNNNYIEYESNGETDCLMNILRKLNLS